MQNKKNKNLNRIISETIKNLRNQIHNNETEKIKEVKKSIKIITVHSINKQDNTLTELDEVISDIRKRNEELRLKEYKIKQKISELKVKKIMQMLKK